MQTAPLLDFALHHLTQGCTALYEWSLDHDPLVEGRPVPQEGPAPNAGEAPRLLAAHLELDVAVDGFRRAGMQDELPQGLLARAMLRGLVGARTSRESAQADLDEAWNIAERGPMRLLMADI